MYREGTGPQAAMFNALQLKRGLAAEPKISVANLVLAYISFFSATHTQNAPTRFGFRLPTGSFKLRARITFRRLVCMVALVVCRAAKSNRSRKYPRWCTGALVKTLPRHSG